MSTRLLTGNIRDVHELARPGFALQVLVTPTAITPTGIIPESVEPIVTDDDGNFAIEVATGVQLEVKLSDAFRHIGTSVHVGNGNIIKRGMVVPHGVSPISVQAVLTLNTEPDAPGDLIALANEHIGNRDNPHNVTPAQLHLENVANVAPAALPISDATQIAIDAVDDAVTAHTSDHDNPHGVTAHQVDAYTQAETDDMVSGVASALAVVSGRTGTLEDRVDAIDADLGDLDTEQSSTALALSNHVADMGNPHGTTKAQLGLDHVTNDAQLKASQLDTGTGLGTDDAKVPSQKAVKAYVDAGLDGKAAKTRAITVGAGLAGGGDLTADRSIALSAATVASLGKADTAVQPDALVGLNTDRHTHANKAVLDGIAAPNLAPNGGLVGQVLTVGASGREWDTPTVTGAEILEPDFSFAVVDEDGRRTWVEANAAGGLTDHAADKISEAVGPSVVASIGLETQDTAITGLAFAVVDEDSRRTELEVGNDGKLTQRVIDSIRDRVGLSIPANIESGPDIVCWGDSMTAGAGGGGTTYPGVLATLTGRTVRNRGVGGETSVTITARTGANPMLVIPDGGTIPSSGGVVIAIQPINGSTPAPLLQGHHGYNVGSIAGVAGTISQSGGVYTFTRSEAGDPVTVNRPTPWMDAESPQRRADIAIIWIGQNGPSHARAKADVAATIRHMDALDKRYLVISRPTSSDVEDAEWHDLYGRRFIAIRQYMVAYGLADAGITPTEQDETDMSNGVVPESLRSDTIHWNAAGYTILGQQCNARLRELGWV